MFLTWRPIGIDSFAFLIMISDAFSMFRTKVMIYAFYLDRPRCCDRTLRSIGANLFAFAVLNIDQTKFLAVIGAVCCMVGSENSIIGNLSTPTSTFPSGNIDHG